MTHFCTRLNYIDYIVNCFMHSDDIKFFDKSKKVGEITLRAILATILDRHGIRSLKAIPEV